MRRIIPLVILLALAFNMHSEITSVSEALTSHREWMKIHTPRPETLDDEQLMLASFEIINLRLKEDEAFRILATAATKVPEVGDYINWDATMKCDRNYQYLRNALLGMKRYLEAVKPGCYGARRLYFEWLNTESMFRNVMTEFDELIKLQEKVCAKSSGKNKKHEESLLLLMKLARFDHRSSLEITDNPLHYPELWQLEQEVVRLYPIKSEETDADRVDLYVALAPLKSLPQENEKVKVMFPDNFNPFDVDPGMMYNYAGTFRDYLCNTGFLYEKASEIAGKIYGEYHPAIATINLKYAQFRLYNQTFTSDLADNIKILHDYMSFYYPKHSIQSQAANQLKLTSDYFNTGVVTDIALLNEIESDARSYYGENNQYFLNVLSSLTSLRLHSDLPVSSFLPAFEEACDRICANSIETAMWKVFPYSELLFIDTATVTEKMLILKDTYLNYHDGTSVSRHLGEQLCIYFNKTAMDYNSALEIANAVALDCKMLFGDLSAPYFLAMKNAAEISLTINKEAINILNDLIELTEKSDFTASRYTLTRLLESKAYYHWNLSQYPLAHETYEKLHGNRFNPEDAGYMVRDAISQVYMSGISDKTDRLIKCSRKLIDTNEVVSLAPALLAEISEYYQLASNPQEAIAMLEKSMEAHNLQTEGALDDEYFDIALRLSDLYSVTNNINAASRLLLSDRENLNSMTRRYASPTMINYFINQYYRYIARNDINAALFYLSTASNMLSQINSSSQQNAVIKYSMLPQFMRAYMHLCKTSLSMLDDSDVKKYIDSDDFKQYNIDMEKILKPLTMLLPTFKEWLAELEETYPQFDPDYKNNPNYILILSSFADYYTFYEKDYQKAEEYLLKCTELYNSPADKKTQYFILADLMNQTGNEIKKQEYIDKAYTLIEKNPELMTDADKLGAVSYRFNKSMEAGDTEDAIVKARYLYSAVRKMLDGSFQLMTSNDQDAIFNQYGDPAWALTSVLERKPDEMASETYNAIVYRTGMQLRSQQELQHLISNTNNPEIRTLADSIAGMRAELKAVKSTPDTWGTDEGTKLFNHTSDLKYRTELLEQRLLDLTADMRISVNPDIHWEKIRDTLTPGEAAIEFLYSYKKVMALVLTPGCKSPRAVSLCDWQELADNLNSLHTKNSAAMARKLYGAVSPVELYRMLWQPLESHLDGVKTIYFNAPGILHTIAFNAISTPDGSYLIDKYDLRQLTTTAQLTFDRSVRTPGSAALVGDVIFDPSQEKLRGVIPDNTGERNIDEDYSLLAMDNDSDSRGVARQYFRYLPFTAQEINEIKNTMPQSKINTSLGSEATEENFRLLCSAKPEVLHIATHGFFLSSDTEALRVPFMKKYSSAVASPMQRSGIALANAEATWIGKTDLPEDSDGILTANEVSQLDLKGTQLVALSACETALGGYNFEGIHGLTRGFKQAGAESLLVSLWSVNDQSTSIFMSAFYSNWQKDGDRHAAYRKAIAKVRETYPSPFYWAPFILLD